MGGRPPWGRGGGGGLRWFSRLACFRLNIVDSHSQASVGRKQNFLPKERLPMSISPPLLCFSFFVFFCQSKGKHNILSVKYCRQSVRHREDGTNISPLKGAIADVDPPLFLFYFCNTQGDGGRKGLWTRSAIARNHILVPHNTYNKKEAKDGEM